MLLFLKTEMFLCFRYGGAALLGQQTTVPERQGSPEEMKIHLCSSFSRKIERGESELVREYREKEVGKMGAILGLRGIYTQ